MVQGTWAPREAKCPIIILELGVKDSPKEAKFSFGWKTTVQLSLLFIFQDWTIGRQVISAVTACTRANSLFIFNCFYQKYGAPDVDIWLLGSLALDSQSDVWLMYAFPPV